MERKVEISNWNVTQRPDGVIIEPVQNDEVKHVNGNYADPDEDEEVEDDLVLGDEDQLEGDEEEFEVELDDTDLDEDDFDDDDLVIDTDDDIEEDEEDDV